MSKENCFKIDSSLIRRYEPELEETKMAKYTQEVKDQCVAAVKEGKSFKEIQQTLGPNPKAVQRYLKAAGVDWPALKKELIEQGKLKPSVNKQGKKAKKGAATTAQDIVAEETVIEE